MSRRWTVAFGRHVQGYRKTARQQSSARAPEEMPDFRLTFYLPGLLGISRPGPAGVIGVEIKKDGKVEVCGRDREWVLRQAAEYIDKIGGPNELTITATLTRGDEKSPTLSGPIRRGYRVSHEFILVRGPAVIVAQPYDRPLILPAKRT